MSRISPFPLNNRIEILAVEQESRIYYLIGEHFVHSVAAFIGTFSLLFFGPMYTDLPDEMINNLTSFILESAHTTIPICLAGVLIINAFLVIKNSRKRHIVGIFYQESTDTLTFELVNLYSKQAKRINTPLRSIRFQEEEKNFFDLFTKQVIIFRQSEIPFGRIDPELDIWTQHRTRLIKGLKYLRMLKDSPKRI